jgi:hypothetical protein
LLGEISLRLRQGLRFDQKTLSFVATPALTEPHYHGMSRALRLSPARKQRIPGGQEFKIAETDTPQARWARILHYQKIPGAAASMARPHGVQWLNYHKFRCTTCLLRQALTLDFGQIA